MQSPCVLSLRIICVFLVTITATLCQPRHSAAQAREESATEIITATARPTTTATPDLNAVSETIIQMTNEFRKSEGLDPVKSNSKLSETADYFAGYMAKTDKYGHTADGKRPAERASDHGYEFCIVSENIAYQYQSTGFQANELAQGFVEGWKNSPEHRENMLDPDVTETGVAVARSDETGHFYAVQMFGRPRSDSIRFQIANNTGATVHYRLGDKKFKLEPRFTRVHEQCRPPTVRFLGEDPDAEEPQKVLKPEGGAALEVVQEGQGTTITRQSQQNQPKSN